MDEQTIEYINHYYCQDCVTEWQDVWECACNDKCPTCNKEIEPEKSELTKSSW